MVSIHNLVLNRETRSGKWIHLALRRVSKVSFPVIPGLHHLLLAERVCRRRVLAQIWSKVYHEPLLKLSCKSVGRGLFLHEKMPKILGNLEVTLGDRVSLSGEQVWIATGSGGKCFLAIGDDSYIGHASQLIVGTEINVGKHVRIANRVILNGYDGHPLDPFARAAREPPGRHGVGRIHVGDYAWICNDSIVLKGVTIGRGAVVASGSVVTHDVPELTVVAGIPARPVKNIDAPPGW